MEQQPTSDFSIPSDLTSEILLRLPAKSVGRLRCVSKLWLSITNDPCFIKSFGATRPDLLLCSIKDHNMFVTHDLSSIRSYSSSQPFYRMELPGKHCYFSPMDSVHGLICIGDSKSKMPLVWNPTLGQLLALPKPKISSKYMNVFLGYDPVQVEHKVVCLPHKKTCYVGRVFTLGSGQESWRTVRTIFEHRVSGYAYGRCINGVIYYLAFNAAIWYDTVVMSFDVRSEIFHKIEPPSSIHCGVLMSYKGRLACLNNKILWSLDVADKHKWSFQDFLLPLNDRILTESSDNCVEEYLFHLRGSTNAGEFIYVAPKSSYVLFYDPVRSCCRRLKYEGIVDGEFTKDIQVFPNHIENLMSL